MISHKSWLEINKKNLLFNFWQLKKRIGDKVKIAAVVKANAYGHGLREVVSILKDQADYFAVDSLHEARQIKDLTESKILILGYTIFADLPEVVQDDFQQVVANFKTLKKLNTLAKNKKKIVSIHLKIETGTSRQGIFLKDLPKFLKFINSNKHLQLAGISTHFANIEDTTNHSFAQKQRLEFLKADDLLKKFGFRDYLRHAACSAAAILFPDTFFDLARVGISLYGHWSSDTTKLSAQQEKINIKLKPVLSWKTIIAHIKEIPAGSTVGYGCSEKLFKKTKIAVLPIGYYDGFDRKLSGQGKVLINGQICKVIGRVCMNMTMVDVNNLPKVKLEDEVVIIGKQGKEILSVENLANQINSINYEVLTRINQGIFKKIV